MSALGQKQTCAVQKACPLYPQKRTCAVQLGDVRFVPIADIEGLSEGRLNSDEHSSAGQDNPDFGELAELCIDLD